MTLNPQTMTKGSPPQVRGKPFPADGSSTVRRITPAGAGKTFLSHLFCWLCQGSPPQVRGKRSIGQLLFLPEGITPAGAGKTIVPVLFLCLPADHPRRCGENLGFWVFEVRQMGSPPQVRGKPFETSTASHSTRITPAGAGKTTCRRRRGLLPWDHPRGCGENLPFESVVWKEKGSPPRMRGKLNFSCSLLGVTRITPADAGKTSWDSSDLIPV